MREAVIVDAIRTPIGKKGGTLSKVRSDELGVIVLNELLRRTGIDPEQIDDVVTGCVTQTGEQGANISRNIVLAAGLPVTVPGTSVNRLCASSVQAFVNAAQAVMSGMMDLTVVLGVESMNRVAMGSDLGSLSPRLMERFAVVPQGISAELIAEKWELGRGQNDELALMSQDRALKAVRSGAFQREIVPVRATGDDGKPVVLEQDETPRDSSMEKLAKLPPAFKPDGVITAGNSSQISDGAAGLIVTTPEKAKQLGLEPRARLVTYAVAGVCPTIMLTAPIPATRKALAKAGLGLADVGVVEINEAFSSVVLACGQDLGFDWSKTNIRGGAIALGHPLGATGARLLTTALHLMEDRKERYGLVTLCIGFGQGETVILERL
ncbi:MAG TPA: thiolase family protein [Polyangia bacterium]